MKRTRLLIMALVAVVVLSLAGWALVLPAAVNGLDRLIGDRSTVAEAAPLFNEDNSQPAAGRASELLVQGDLLF